MLSGLRTMHRSLTVGDISLDAGEVLACSAEFTMGRDTAEAVGYGIQQCLTLFVDGVCDRLARSFRDEPERIVTGGDAVLLLPLLNDRYHHIPNLVLEGLALVAREVSGDHA